MYYYYRYNTGPSTLKRMLVTSYQCCNGNLGCGTQIQCSDASDSGTYVKYNIYYRYPIRDWPTACDLGPWRVYTNYSTLPSYAQHQHARKELLGTHTTAVVNFPALNNTSRADYRPAVRSMSYVLALKFQHSSNSSTDPQAPSDSLSASYLLWDPCQPQ